MAVAIFAAAAIAGFQHWADRRRERQRDAAQAAATAVHETVQRRKLRIQLFPVLVMIRAHLSTLEKNTRRAHDDMIIDDSRLRLLKVPHIERLADFVETAHLLPFDEMQDFLNLLEWGRLYNDMVALVVARSSDGKGWVLNKFAVGEPHIQHIRKLAAFCESVFTWAFRETYGKDAVPLTHGLIEPAPPAL